MEAKLSQSSHQPFFEFLYCMGKCASCSLYAAMQPPDYSDLQYHNVKHYETATLLRAHTLGLGMLDGLIRETPLREINQVKVKRLKWIVETKQPLRIVTIVRNPVDRAISAIFHHHKRWIQKLHKPFHEMLEDGFNKDWALDWFDNHLLPPFGIDVYSKPWDFKTKHITLEVDNVSCLVLRTEDSKLWKPMVEEFLDRPIRGIGKLNIGHNAIEFKKRRVRLSDSFLDYMLNSKLSKHFYSPVERHQFRTKYQKP